MINGAAQGKGLSGDSAKAAATITSTHTQTQTVPPTDHAATTASTAGTSSSEPQNQPVDVLALGDYSLWSLLPEHRVCYYHSRQSDARSGPNHHHHHHHHHHPRAAGTYVWNYSRNLVRRARGAWSRWRLRSDRSDRSDRSGRSETSRDARSGSEQD